MKSLLLSLTLLGWMLSPLAADSGCTRHLAGDTKAKVTAGAEAKATCGSCASAAAKTPCACQDGGTCACASGQCACGAEKACCDAHKKSCCKSDGKDCASCTAKCDQCAKACPTCGAATVAATEEPAGHPLTGVVVQVMAERQALLVKHEEIPGVMRAMTMMLRVDEQTLKSVNAGDAITAIMFRDAEGRWALRDVKLSQG
jgi:Cu/Ag efflux protein CusF